MHEVKKQNSYSVDRQQRGSVKELHASVDGLLCASEEWRDVKEYEGLYQVSNYGRVKNRKGKLLKPFSSERGYLSIDLMNKNRKSMKVHRLVALLFIENPKNKASVNHIDNNPANNYVLNLEWCTQKENMIHAFKQERVNKRQGKSILTIKKVKEIRKLKGKFSSNELKNKYKVDRKTIENIWNKKTWNYI